MGLAVPHQIKANVHKKAKQDPGVIPPPATAGIDFLKAIEAKQTISPAPMSFINLFGEEEQTEDYNQ